MEKLTIFAVFACLVFVIGSLFFEIPQLANQIVYGIMSVFGLLYLFFNSKKIGIRNMFDKDPEA